jgi:prephenate dehydratase
MPPIASFRTVAFQGERGAYSEEAARALAPGAARHPLPTFEAVFEAVEGGAVEGAVVPIENTLHGSVHVNYDHLLAHAVRITGEHLLRIRHHLVAVPGATVEGLRVVRSHPQALGQCRGYLRARLPHATPEPAYDTAGAARAVARAADPAAAAIASRAAAATYGLAVLDAEIEDDPQNYTRFLALQPAPDDAASNNDADDAAAGVDDDGVAYKTSVVFTLRQNVPGALFKSLAVFALRDLDLYKIESRPLVGMPGSYRFYLDVAGHAAAEPVRRALDHLREITTLLRVLGTYPAAAPAPDAGEGVSRRGRGG